MSMVEGYLPGQPNGVVGVVPEQDLNAIFYQYSTLLNRVARSVTRDASEAEDVVQETSCERCVTTISSLNFEIHGCG
jgi:hypothetical protein